MIRSFLLFSLVALLAAPLAAQITLTSSGLPSGGEKVVLQKIDSTWLDDLDFSETGGGQLWDFSGVAIDTAAPDTMMFVTPASTPFADSFPAATLVATPDPEDPGAGFEYWEITSEVFNVLGFMDTVTFNKNFPPEIRLEFPVDTGMSIEQDYISYLDVLEFQDSGMIQQRVSVDAWGEITLPSGTYECLRIKQERTEEYVTFDLPIKVEQTIYEFWTTEFPVPVFRYEIQRSNLFEGDDETLTGEFLLPEGEVTATNQPAKARPKLRVFPNPTHGSLYIWQTGSHPGPVTLVDARGNQVLQNNGSGQKLQLDLSMLPSGIYYLLVRETGGKTKTTPVILIR